MQELKVKSIFDFLKNRTDEVVMVVRNNEGQILFIRKHYYPKDIYRIPAGGVEKNELPEIALKREIEEEFHTPMEILENLGICVVKLIDLSEEREINSHVFLLKPLEPLSIEKDEEHSAHLWVDTKDMPKIIDKLENMEEWPGWGEFRALTTRYVYEKLS
jgi:ADP-ribose pyrophosphatase YjhB (NUDIX family)